MANLHEAIYALNPTVVTICDDVAYDENKQEVKYNLEAAQTKLIELETAKIAAEQAKINSKVSALAKLTALGLTEDEVKALVS